MTNWIMKAELYVTTKCTGGCPFCFGQGDFGIRGRHVPIERLLRRAEILAAFHQRHPFSVVPLLGGEPLLHPDLPELVRTYGQRLPFALVSAGEPDGAVPIESLIGHVRRWGVTYTPRLADRYLRLMTTLLDAKQEVETSMHFRDFASFQAVNAHFRDHALPRLHWIRHSCRAAFARYLSSWRRDTYYAASFTPFFHQNAGLLVTVRYSIIDGRFTRTTPKRFAPPLHPRGRRFPCHLFTESKAIAIAEDGRVLPCTSNAQRHAHPVIMDLNTFGRIPDDLPEYLDACGKMLLDAGHDGFCDVSCQRMQWHLNA